MIFFYEKAKQATFVCEYFTKTLKRAKKWSVIYNYPPYVPWNKISCFTEYRGAGNSKKGSSLLRSRIEVRYQFMKDNTTFGWDHYTGGLPEK